LATNFTQFKRRRAEIKAQDLNKANERLRKVDNLKFAKSLESVLLQTLDGTNNLHSLLAYRLQVSAALRSGKAINYNKEKLQTLKGILKDLDRHIAAHRRIKTSPRD